MRLLICAYEDVGAGRVPMDELSDLEDAVAYCRELVESEGYARAEVWSGVGRRVYVIEREGEEVHESEAPDESTLFDSSAPLCEPLVRRADPRDEEAQTGPRPRDARPPHSTDAGEDAPNEAVPDQEVAGERVAGTGTGGATRAPAPDLPERPSGLLGEQPGTGERWFGL